VGDAPRHIHELAHPRRRHERVVRRDARLTRIHALADENPLGRRRDRIVRTDDRRGFSPELQRDGRKVFRRGAHHRRPDGGGSGKQQVIERQRRERPRDLRIAVHDPDLVRSEVLPDERLEERAGRRRELGHFEHRAITRGQRADERADREVDGIVPRHDDSHDAERLGNHLGPARQEPERDRAPLRPHPTAEAAARVLRCLQARKDLQQARLVVRAMPEVARNRARDRLDVRAQQPLECGQSALARRGVRKRRASERFALRIECALEMIRLRGKPMRRGSRHANAPRGATHSNPRSRGDP
jgi:hypothetical protein